MEVLDFAVFTTGYINISTTQATFTCSKSTIKALEKGVKCVQS